MRRRQWLVGIKRTMPTSSKLMAKATKVIRSLAMTTDMTREQYGPLPETSLRMAICRKHDAVKQDQPPPPQSARGMLTG